MSFLAPHRTDSPGDDPIFSLHLEAVGRKAKGDDVINATVGVLLDDEGRLLLIDVVPEVLRALPPAIGAAYPPIAGPPAFLQAVIADLLPDPEDACFAVAVATPGGSGALHHAITNFLEPGQCALTTSQHWSPYGVICDALGRKLSTFRMWNAEGHLDVDDFEEQLAAILRTQGRALLILNTPCHNPTGYSLSEDELLRITSVLRDFAKRGPISVVIDAAYDRYGTSTLARARSILMRAAGDIMLLFAWSASKAFTQYGLRVGALVAVHPDDHIRRAAAAALGFSCRGTWSTCNAAGMAAITRVLTEPELRERADRERALLKQLLHKRAAHWKSLCADLKLACPPWDGGFFSTVLTDGSFAIAEKLRQDGLYVVPVHGGLRVALCSVPEPALSRLAAGIAKHTARG